MITQLEIDNIPLGILPTIATSIDMELFEHIITSFNASATGFILPTITNVITLNQRSYITNIKGK